jgi:hypothetical protein
MSSPEGRVAEAERPAPPPWLRRGAEEVVHTVGQPSLRLGLRLATSWPAQQHQLQVARRGAVRDHRQSMAYAGSYWCGGPCQHTDLQKRHSQMRFGAIPAAFDGR